MASRRWRFGAASVVELWYEPIGRRLGARAACASVELLWDPPFVDGPGSALRAPKGQANAGPKPSVVRILALSRKAREEVEGLQPSQVLAPPKSE